MRHSYISQFLLALACAALSACGSGGGAAPETMASSSTGMMAKASLSTTTYAPDAPTAASTWTPCATENGTCSFTGQAQIRYGTETNFVIKTLTGPVACSNTVFGDPIVGQVKSCSIGVTPIVWTVCATEGNICAVSGSTEVRYGTDTNYFTKTVTGPFACKNEMFGDPAHGVVKSCKVDSRAMAAAAAVTWTECAAEGNTCSVVGTYDIRYGTATQFVTKTVTGPVACTNATFGDPAPTFAKSCKVVASSDLSLSVPQVVTPAPLPAPLPAPAPTPVPMPVSVSGAITTVQLINPGSAAQNNAATTFGQAFAQGDVPRGSTLIGKLSNGNTVPVQVDAKARHADGSIRHAVVTVQLPSLGAQQAETVGLVRDSAVSATTPATPATLLGNGFSASFNATIGGVRYSASADELLKSGKYTTWLAGPLTNEWMVAAPLKTASGTEHPLLHARFAIRSYPDTNSARVDVTIENGWANAPTPSNFTYDAQVLVGGKQVFAQAALTHYSHARWRRVFWWGSAPQLNVRHNTAYLIASKAVPNYDQSLTIKESTIASWNLNWISSNTAPMQTGVGVAYMPTTGARADIGPMPTWSALYVLTMDQRVKNITLGMSEQAGSWSAHFRNKQTGRPVMLAEFPNGVLPTCVEARCASPMTIDTSHQPAFSYIPYLMTGDYYHLEELQFWANWSVFSGNPDDWYREGGKGLLKSDQIRGQAWTLRTLAEAAYITPDDDPQKANFAAVLNNNIDWYTNTFSSNPNTNKLGVLDNHIGYLGGTGIAPWQDDFFTTSVGRMVELGFSRAQPLLIWKSKFVVDRMVGAGYCWIDAAAYNLKVRNSTTSPVYSTIAEVYQANTPTALAQLPCASATMAASLGLRVGEMSGDFNSAGPQGIMQPALAYSAPLSATAMKAWALFAARPYKPDLAGNPQYAIVPR